MSDDLVLAWVAAGLASAVALVLAYRAGTEGSRTGALRGELEELRKDSKGRRKQQEQREKSLRGAESDLEKANRKLAQADKRSSQAREAARAERDQASERLLGIEEQLAAATEAKEASLRDLDRVRGELDVSTSNGVQAEARVEELEQLLEAQPPPADPEELRALRERSESAEQKLAERDDSLAKATRDVERLREKARTQEILYTSIRSELSVKKDQIRQQREEIERLQATKVMLGATDSD